MMHFFIINIPRIVVKFTFDPYQLFFDPIIIYPPFTLSRNLPEQRTQFNKQQVPVLSRKLFIWTDEVG